MPNQLSSKELQEWYAQLKTTLYEQVNVDLNRKEDLGRIRIMYITDLHLEDPDVAPDVDIIYPFIPHRPLANDEKSTAPAQAQLATQQTMENSGPNMPNI